MLDQDDEDDDDFIIEDILSDLPDTEDTEEIDFSLEEEGPLNRDI